jgi:hypothetical protein
LLPGKFGQVPAGLRFTRYISRFAQFKKLKFKISLSLRNLLPRADFYEKYKLHYALYLIENEEYQD